jgi:hypothetical protein
MRIIKKLLDHFVSGRQNRMQSGEKIASTSSRRAPSSLITRLRDLRLGPAAISLALNRLLQNNEGRSFLRMGRSGLSKATRFTNKEISPRAARAARKVRHHTKPEKLNKDYKRFLHITQEIGYDRAIEKLFFVPTRGYTALEHLTIDSPNKHFGHDYHPIHRLSFNWAMAQIPDSLGDFTFVDYGAGRGRALLLAAMKPFRKIIGVEFAGELHDDANMNIAQFPRSLMKCRDVNCLLMDAVDFPIPDSKGIFLFNDCFDLEVLETVLARLTSSYRANPRRIYLIFVRPLQAEVLDRLLEHTVIFEPIYHSKSEKMRMQIFSPDQVQIFRSLI